MSLKKEECYLCEIVRSVDGKYKEGETYYFIASNFINGIDVGFRFEDYTMTESEKEENLNYTILRRL